MKDIILKSKVILTNFSRILMSFLFVNVGNFFGNKVEAIQPACYLTSSEDFIKQPVKHFDIGKVFVILVPIAIIIVVAAIIIIKYKNKKNAKQHKERQEEEI